MLSEAVNAENVQIFFRHKLATTGESADFSFRQAEENNESYGDASSFTSARVGNLRLSTVKNITRLNLWRR